MRFFAELNSASILGSGVQLLSQHRSSLRFPSSRPPFFAPLGDGSDYDIGAYEYQGPFVFVSDLDDSGGVDAHDLFVFERGWHSTTGPGAKSDFDRNGFIDVFELLVFLKDWMMSAQVE